MSSEYCRVRRELLERVLDALEVHREASMVTGYTGHAAEAKSIRDDLHLAMLPGIITPKPDADSVELVREIRDGDPTHDHLCEIVRKLPEDYDVWSEGKVERWADSDQAYPDCSMGCKHAQWLEKGDWCVCSNPESHRCGLLTFEHQGCQKFEQEAKDD